MSNSFNQNDNTPHMRDSGSAQHNPHGQQLAQMQVTVMDYIRMLQRFAEDSACEADREDLQHFCGKDSLASTLLKLCQLQQQLIKLEQELAKSQAGEQEDEIHQLSEADWQLLASAISRRKQSLRETKSHGHTSNKSSRRHKTDSKRKEKKRGRQGRV